MATKVSFIGLLLVINLALSTAYCAEKNIRIIANQSVDIDRLDNDQVKRIFTMYQTNWPNAQPIVVFVLANQNGTHQLFSREILGVFPYQLERIWNKLIFSGLGEGPIRVQTESEMLAKVKQQPGAIGYVMTSEIPMGIHLIQLIEEQ